MSKILIQNNLCLNCGHESQEDFQYCPQCSQKNLPSRIHFSVVISDLFQNAFALDSRLGRSIYPFLFKPGFLTTEFNAGRRLSYVNPFRLYLVISLILFFLISLPSTEEATQDSEDFISVREQNSILDAEELSEEKKKELRSKDSTKRENEASMKLSYESNFFEHWTEAFQTIKEKEIKTHKMSKEQLDSLLLVYEIEVGSMNRIILRQGGKAANDSESFENFMKSKLPTTMLLMMPLFAAIVYIFYRSKKVFYLEHLVHAFHLHSFLFFMLLLQALVSLFGYTSQGTGAVIALICAWYFYKSMRNVYLQSRFKTVAKMILLSSIYFAVFVVFIGLNAVLSILTY